MRQDSKSKNDDEWQVKILKEIMKEVRARKKKLRKVKSLSKLLVAILMEFFFPLKTAICRSSGSGSISGCKKQLFSAGHIIGSASGETHTERASIKLFNKRGRLVRDYFKILTNRNASKITFLSKV